MRSRNIQSGLAAVGTCLEEDTLRVTGDQILLYAQAVDDANAWYLDMGRAGGVIAPPMFGIVPANLLLRKAIASGRVPLRLDRTLHGEQDMFFHAPIRPGEKLRTTGEVVSVQRNSAGATITLAIRTVDNAGEARISQLFTLFVRSSGRRKTGPTGAGSRAVEAPIFQESQAISTDQIWRYGHASFTEGIAVHEEVEVAQALGYRSVILAGQCTMAFAARALVNGVVAGGDPTKLKRVSVRFAQVVYPEDMVTTQVWSTANSNIYRFESTNQAGQLVLAEGVAIAES